MGESELAAVVTDYVEETEFPQVFEDTVGSPEDPEDPLEERSGALFDESGHGHPGGHDHTHGDHAADTSGPVDAETEAILEEAREMTREMLQDGDDEAENE
jgi:hypothetical protein